MNKDIKTFKKYILKNHPDPDTLVSDIKVFDQMCRLAENYAESKSNEVIIKEQQQKIEQLEKEVESIRIITDNSKVNQNLIEENTKLKERESEFIEDLEYLQEHCANPTEWINNYIKEMINQINKQ